MVFYHRLWWMFVPFIWDFDVNVFADIPVYIWCNLVMSVYIFCLGKFRASRCYVTYCLLESPNFLLYSSSTSPSWSLLGYFSCISFSFHLCFGCSWTSCCTFFFTFFACVVLGFTFSYFQFWVLVVLSCILLPVLQLSISSFLFFVSIVAIFRSGSSLQVRYVFNPTVVNLPVVTSCIRLPPPPLSSSSYYYNTIQCIYNFLSLKAFVCKDLLILYTWSRQHL